MGSPKYPTGLNEAMLQTIRFVTTHPLTRSQPVHAIGRAILWQLRSRWRSPRLIPWVEDSRLLVETGMTGATGNIYVGLHEFEPMAFLLHVLRPTDIFVDIGANVGTYTVLASAVCGARVISFEPVPLSFERLQANVAVNNRASRVETRKLAIARERGTLRMTIDHDAMNHVIRSSDAAANQIDVPALSLTEALGNAKPFLMKIDVEGFEHEVLAGGLPVLQETSLAALIVELNGSGASYGRDDATLHSELTRLGFKAVTYDPYTRSTHPSSQPHDTGIYIRDSELLAERLRSAPVRQIHPVSKTI